MRLPTGRLISRGSPASISEPPRGALPTACSRAEPPPCLLSTLATARSRRSSATIPALRSASARMHVSLLPANCLHLTVPLRLFCRWTYLSSPHPRAPRRVGSTKLRTNSAGKALPSFWSNRSSKPGARTGREASSATPKPASKPSTRPRVRRRAGRHGHRGHRFADPRNGRESRIPASRSILVKPV